MLAARSSDETRSKKEAERGFSTSRMSRDGAYFRCLAQETDARLAALCLEYDPDAIKLAQPSPAAITDEGLLASGFRLLALTRSQLTGRFARRWVRPGY